MSPISTTASRRAGMAVSVPSSALRGRIEPRDLTLLRVALHFKLAVAKDTEGGYEDTEFQYTPRLDGNRDRDLIALLPEYLTDEITFSRTNAAMFYGRVVETLTKKRPVEVLQD